MTLFFYILQCVALFTSGILLFGWAKYATDKLPTKGTEEYEQMSGLQSLLRVAVITLCFIFGLTLVVYGPTRFILFLIA